MRALRTFDSFERTLYLWVVLESLSPEIKTVPTCDRCDAEHELVCPACGIAEPGHRVLKSIESHLRGLIDRKSLRRLYKLRSELVHGRMLTDTHNAAKLAMQVMALTQLTMNAVKRELGWKINQPPNFSLQGVTPNTVVGQTEMQFVNEQGRKEPFRIDVDPIIVSAPHGKPPGPFHDL